MVFVTLFREHNFRQGFLFEKNGKMADLKFYFPFPYQPGRFKIKMGQAKFWPEVDFFDDFINSMVDLVELENKIWG